MPRLWKSVYVDNQTDADAFDLWASTRGATHIPSLDIEQDWDETDEDEDDNLPDDYDDDILDEDEDDIFDDDKEML